MSSLSFKIDHNSQISQLDILRSLIANDLDKVDRNIIDLVGGYADLIPQISLHTILSGGKRIRPILTLASSKLCGYEGNAHVDLATAIEFIHTATLLHDDVVDTSLMRRGKKTANEIWGNKESILVGDFLLGRAFYLMGKADSLEIYKILSRSSMIISEGEVMQLAIEANIAAGYENYLTVINAKTGELFAAACEVAAVISNKDKKTQEALRNYGMNLGIAFQIVDDVLDYWSGEEVLGKDIGNDFKESKITLPLLMLYNSVGDQEKEYIENILSLEVKTSDELKRIIDLLNHHNIFNISIEYAKNFITKAEKSLEIFANCEMKMALINLLNYVVKRLY